MTVIKDSPVTKSLFLSIKLGNPKYKCGRYGICEINPDDDGSFYGQGIVEKRVRAKVFTTQQQQLRFLFDSKSMTAKTDEVYFSNGLFIVEIAKELPWAITQKLGIQPCEIKAGLYSISRHTSFYQVVMDVKHITSIIHHNCKSTKNIN